MGYFYFALALAAGGTKAYCGKKTSGAIVLSSDSMLMNCLRMGICVVIGFFLVLLRGELSSLVPDTTLSIIALLSGVSSAVFVVSWLLSVKGGAYMMVEVFLLLGVAVPIALCRLFLEEPITLGQGGAILLLLVAVYLMCTYNTALHGRMKPRELALLALCGIANGLSDFSQKLFVKLRPEGSVAAFNLYTYLLAGGILLAAYLVFRRAEKGRAMVSRAPLAVIKPIAVYVLVMAACLFAYSFFKTEAAKYLDAALLYPLSQGAGVLVSLFLSLAFFKEKINGRGILGILLSLAALLLLNW